MAEVESNDIEIVQALIFENLGDELDEKIITRKMYGKKWTLRRLSLDISLMKTGLTKLSMNKK